MNTENDVKAGGGRAIRVEVSGWDRTGGYFVERTEARIESNRMVICLPRAVVARTLVFVRMVLAHGALEQNSRMMEVIRTQKGGSGYCVHCRVARRPRNGSQPPQH